MSTDQTHDAGLADTHPTPEGHLDADLFELFVSARVYRDYAEKYLLPEQLDEVGGRF